MMKTAAFAFVLFFAAFASAETNLVEEDLSESPRFGFLDLNNDGATLTFNSTSLQYGVIAGVVLLLVALVVVPLLGFDLGTLLNRDSYDYGNYAYEQPGYASSYTNYAKRSLNLLSPVLKALTDAYEKYE